MKTCELVNSKKEKIVKFSKEAFDFNEFKKEFQKDNILTKEEILKFSKEEFFTEGEKKYLRGI